MQIKITTKFINLNAGTQIDNGENKQASTFLGFTKDDIKFQ